MKILNFRQEDNCYIWKDSFDSKEHKRPGEAVVRDYLMRQLGKAEESCGTDDEQRYAINGEIIRQTEGYCPGIRAASEDHIQEDIANNSVLLYFLKSELADLRAEQENLKTQRICVLLRAAFTDKAFSDSCFTTEEKRQLLSFLGMCGLETDRAECKTVYTNSAEGEEFRFLRALRGWIWELDQQADRMMAAALLYVAWRLKEPALEKHMLELLEKRFADINRRVQFWLGLMQEARLEGGEWERHAKEMSLEAIGKVDTEKYNRSMISVTTRKLMILYWPELEGQLDSRPQVSEACDGERYEAELPELCAADRDYEVCKNGYFPMVFSSVCEIWSLADEIAWP